MNRIVNAAASHPLAVVACPAGRGRRSARGFTLIEMMIGILIGLFTILMITSVLVITSARSRTTAQGSDAQTNGALALLTLQREIQAAGYGALASTGAIGCTVDGFAKFTLAPVIITAGIGSKPDSLTILSGNTQRASLPIGLVDSADPASSTLVTDPALDVQQGDEMILVPASGTSCDSITVAGDIASNFTNIPYKPDKTFAAGDFTGGSPSGPRAYLLDMGQSPTLRTYSIDDTFDLVSTDLVTPGATPQNQYSQIVNLKARYVKSDTSTTGGVTYDTSTPTSNAEWLKVVAIRIALVARSNQYEKDPVTTTAPTWDLGDGSPPIDLMTDLGLDAWQHYRYKVYDVTVPLQNMLWNLPSSSS
jgi:type IV pilus assembly protein PilW